MSRGLVAGQMDLFAEEAPEVKPLPEWIVQVAASRRARPVREGDCESCGVPLFDGKARCKWCRQDAMMQIADGAMRRWWVYTRHWPSASSLADVIADICVVLVMQYEERTGQRRRPKKRADSDIPGDWIKTLQEWHELCVDQEAFLERVGPGVREHLAS